MGVPIRLVFRLKFRSWLQLVSLTLGKKSKLIVNENLPLSVALVGVELGGRDEGDIHQKGSCSSPIRESICWRSSRLCGGPWRKRSMYLWEQKSVLLVRGDSNSSIKDLFIIVTKSIQTVTLSGPILLTNILMFFCDVVKLDTSIITKNWSILCQHWILLFSQLWCLHVRSTAGGRPGLCKNICQLTICDTKTTVPFFKQLVALWIQSLRFHTYRTQNLRKQTNKQKQWTNKNQKCCIQMCLVAAYCLFFFLWQRLYAGWVVVCLLSFGCWLVGTLLCEQRLTVKWNNTCDQMDRTKMWLIYKYGILNSYLDFITAVGRQK